LQWVGRARARQDHISRIKRTDSPVQVLNNDLGPLRERITRLRGERCIYFDGRYLPCGPGEFGGDRGVITSAAAEMKNLGIGSDAELIE
jgi:hypothetical protein